MLQWEQETTSSESSSMFSSIGCMAWRKEENESAMASSQEHQQERFLGGFFLQLFRWDGSVYQAVWKAVVIWLLLFYAISLLDSFILTGERHKTFEAICVYCDAWISTLPVGILLAMLLFFICIRWWKMWDLLPWPDTVALYVTASIIGQEERTRQMRLTIVRYMNFACVQAMALFVPSFQKRFLRWKDFVDAGLVSDNEKAILQDMSSSENVQNMYHVPLVWASTIVTRARRENRITSDEAAHKLLDQIAEFRRRCGTSLHVGLVQIPLMFMQVVTLVVYAYFAGALLGRQFITQGRHTVDMWVPLFTLAEIVFYWGWLKTAEALLCPYGSAGDRAFDMDWIIDRHIKVGNMIVDDMHGCYPEMVRDYEKMYMPGISITVTEEGDFREKQAPQASPCSRRRKNNSIVSLLANGIAGQPLSAGLSKAKNKLMGSFSVLMNASSSNDEEKGEAKKDGSSDKAGVAPKLKKPERRRKRLSEPTPRRARLGSFSSVPEPGTLAKLVIPQRGKRFRGTKLTVMPAVEEHSGEHYLTVEAPEELKRPGTLPMARKVRHWPIRRISSSGGSDDEDMSDPEQYSPPSATISQPPMSAMPMDTKQSPFWASAPKPKASEKDGSYDNPYFSFQDEVNRPNFMKASSMGGGSNSQSCPVKMDCLKVPDTARAFFRLGSSISGASDYFCSSDSRYAHSLGADDMSRI